jgi:hypothetical protein
MNKSVVWIFMGLAFAGLAGCNMPSSQDNSISASPNATQIFQTVLARLTQTQSGAPASTASPPPPPGRNPTVTAQPIAVVTQSPDASSQASKTNQACDRAAPGVLFSGDAMGAASSVPLSQMVLPGQGIDIAVDMVAPRAAGMFQGNWKLRNPDNQWFGIGPNGDSPFWVRIVVPATPTPSPTLTPEVSPVPSVTPIPTPTAQASGTITLTLGTKIDLDNGDLDPASGADLAYEANSRQRHLLTPVDKAVLGVFGVERPNLEDCRSEAMGSVEYVVEDLNDETYLCYHTNQGLPGWMLIAHLDSTNDALRLQYFTWAQP